ncbi:hypothetical protein [Brumicola blandensis]|uniref:Uncharacterized protein n=1 Tax=Brumicola blandensis TaxID=3075611 RepID=A0AAW8QWG4_9ALTE|nr:hypothetical protein [Alteromonas sp. W409]MDT0581441.1 hypothetical protein [Alteromonas sp. W409]
MDNLSEKQKQAYVKICTPLSDEARKVANAVIQYLAECNVGKYIKPALEGYDPFDDDLYVDEFNYSEDEILKYIETAKEDALTFDFCCYLAGKHLEKSKGLEEFGRKVLQNKEKRPRNKAGSKTLNPIRNTIICHSVARGKGFGPPIHNDDYPETVCNITQIILLEVFSIQCNVKNIWIKRNTKGT